MISLDPQITHAEARRMADCLGLKIILKKGEVAHYVITPETPEHGARKETGNDN